MMKLCPKCREEKPADEFGLNRSRKDGLTHYCRLCHRAAGTRQRNRRRAGIPPNLRPRREYQRTFKTTRTNFRSAIKRKYGLTVTIYDSLLVAQSGRCSGCCHPMRRPYVDHDHSTGVVRGLLCQWCNSAVGQAMDEPETLRRLATYLEAARGPGEALG